MEQINGLEKVIKILGSRTINIPATMIFIIGVIFFFPQFLLFLSIPKIVLDYEGWFKFATYVSFVILFVNFFIWFCKKISFISYEKKEKQELRQKILLLDNIEKDIFLELYYQVNNRFIVDDPVIIELCRKKIIYICSHMGEKVVVNGNILTVFPYAITKKALNLIEKEKLIKIEN